MRGAIEFLNRAGVSPSGLVAALFPEDSTVQDAYDSSGLGNHFHQLTAGNQYALVSAIAAGPKVWDLDGSDFFHQVEKDDETDVISFNIISTDGSAALDAPGFSNEDLETYGAEINTDANCTSPTNEADAVDGGSGWTNSGFATFASVAEGTEPSGTYSLHCVSNGANDDAYMSFTTVIDSTYLIETYIKTGDAGVDRLQILVGIAPNTTTNYGSTGWTAATFTKKRSVFVATATTTYITYKENDGDNLTEFWISSVSILNITNPGLSQLQTPSGTTPLAYRVRLGDATPDYAWAYIGEADAVEGFGGEKVQGDDLDFDTVGNWVEGSDATLTGGYNSGDPGHDKVLRIESGAAAAEYADLPQAALDAVLIPGKMYIVSFDYKWISVTSGSTLIQIGGAEARDEMGKEIVWTSGSYRITAIDNTSPSRIYVTVTGGVADELLIDNYSIKEVTALGTTGVHLYDDPDASNRNLTGLSATFDPNGIVTLEVYKTIGTTNLTGDMTVLMVVKPDDGQPASDECIISKWKPAGSDTRSWALFHLQGGDADAGKLQLSPSGDGLGGNAVKTNSAVFSDGAQAGFKNIAWVYNGTTIVFYADGAVVASTVDGAVPVTLYDGFHPLMVGALDLDTPANFFNGQLGLIMIFEVTKTAAEIQRIHLQLLEEGFISL